MPTSPRRPAAALVAFVALLGPPTAGKSTVAAALAADLRVRTFRIREFARHCRETGVLPAELFQTVDPFGWFGDAAVDKLLRAAFLHGHFDTKGLVLLENFPGTVNQLHLLHGISRLRIAPLTVIELMAEPATLLARANARRVCPTCDPDPDGDPHQPATAGRASSEHCGRCGDRLRRRSSDDPQIAPARLERYQRRIADIRVGVVRLGLPYRAIDASGSPAACARAAHAAIHSLCGLHPSPAVPAAR